LDPTVVAAAASILGEAAEQPPPESGADLYRMVDWLRTVSLTLKGPAELQQGVTDMHQALLLQYRWVEGGGKGEGFWDHRGFTRMKPAMVMVAGRGRCSRA
jgi:hypothetical protein